MSDSLVLVRQLACLLAPGGSLYIEVPWGPFYFHHHLARLARWTPPAMHEHVNFFSANAVRHLLSGTELRVTDCRIHRFDLGWTVADVVSTIAGRVAPSDIVKPAIGRGALPPDFSRGALAKAAEKLLG